VIYELTDIANHKAELCRETTEDNWTVKPLSPYFFKLDSKPFKFKNPNTEIFER